MTIYMPCGEASGETSPADTLKSDASLQNCEKMGEFLLLKPPNLWHFITVA